MADFGKRSLFFFLLALLFSAFLRINFMYYFLVIEFFYVVYLLSLRTEINDNDDKRIHITQTQQEDIILQLPVKINQWWNYDIPKELPIKSMSGKSYHLRHNRANTVMSFVEIIDANNQRINFRRKNNIWYSFPL